MRTLRRAPAAPTRPPNMLHATPSPLQSFPARLCPVCAPPRCFPPQRCPPRCCPLRCRSPRPSFTRPCRLPRPSSDCLRHDAVHLMAMARRGLPHAAEHQGTCPRDAPRTHVVPCAVLGDPSFDRAAVAYATVLARPYPPDTMPSSVRPWSTCYFLVPLLPVATPFYARPQTACATVLCPRARRVHNNWSRQGRRVANSGFHLIKPQLFKNCQ